MIRITNGIHTLTVTEGAYKTMYAPQGWIEVSDSKTPEMVSDGSSDLGDNLPDHESEDTTEAISGQENDDTEDDAEDDSENEDVDFEETPLSEMNSAQLRAYANHLGVDVTGMTSKKAVRDKIRAAL